MFFKHFHTFYVKMSISCSAWAMLMIVKKVIKGIIKEFPRITFILKLVMLYFSMKKWIHMGEILFINTNSLKNTNEVWYSFK